MIYISCGGAGRMSANKSIGGNVPYGYIADGGVLALDEDRAAAVREI